ncbi:MAG: lytic transglycosylase domain-containing protein [Thermodesulfobacteriota bacterium]|nr:lytic transglycosylase domain-containing protein [Thermodesulfobacteriota bacterium]
MMTRAIRFIFIFFFLLIGCATTRPHERDLERGPERVIVQVKSSEGVDPLTEKIRALEDSITKLQAEIAAMEERLKATQVRPPLHTFKLPKEISLCGERIPLEDRNVWENLDREFIVTLDSEAQVLLWMKRARRYFPYIEKRLKERSLPDDLKYIAITESSLRPHAVSSSGAAGIWQFIPSTGEKYGMRRNKAIDERFDFFKATEGALTYLKNLYDEFGSWTLAMAAYNTGENRIRREIEFQKTKSYFYLDLSMETRRYVYKIAVAKIILSDPKRYGFNLDEREFYDPLQTDRVQIELKQSLPMMEVARAIGFYYKEIKEMNPHLPEDAIPPGIQFLNLPPGTSERFWNFFSTWKWEAEGR